MNGKKKLSLFVALATAASMFSGMATSAATPEAVHRDSYDDVTVSHWAYEWVTYMTDRDYIHGYPTEENFGQVLYKPEQNITRAEFATILYFMLQPTVGAGVTFTDVDVDDWYYEYIDKAVAAGYMSGYTDGSMRPNAFITREEATSIVYRAFNIPKYTEVSEFADADEISDWAYEAIMSLAQEGVIVGYTGEVEDGLTINPKANILRAEVATLLAKAEQGFPQTKVTFGDKVADEEGGYYVPVTIIPEGDATSITVDISVVGPNPSNVTYVGSDGVENTVTPDEFSKIVFTPEELAATEIKVNFPTPTPGSTSQIEVTVKNAETEADIKEGEATVSFDSVDAGEVTPALGEAEYSTSAGGSVPVSYDAATEVEKVKVAIESTSTGAGTPKVTYTKDGTTHTVTIDELAEVEFTPEELENADMQIVYPDANNGSKATITVTVKNAADDTTLGTTTGDRTFKTESTGGGGGGGFGSGSVSYKVEYVYIYPDGSTATVTKNVKKNNTAEDLGGDITTWYTDEACTEEYTFPKVTAATTIYTMITRDRVVEALEAYQAMNGQGTAVATAKAAEWASDTYNTELTVAFDGTDWWTDSMINVIITNDLNVLGDGNVGDDTVADSLETVADDVARYVVDNMADFSGADVTSANKIEYVKYFQAMVKVIAAAAEDAADAYVAALPGSDAVAEEAQAAFDAFMTQAYVSVAQNAESIADADEAMVESLKTNAFNYCKTVFDAMGVDGMKAAFAAFGADLTAENVLDVIAANTIYAR